MAVRGPPGLSREDGAHHGLRLRQLLLGGEPERYLLRRLSEQGLSLRVTVYVLPPGRTGALRVAATREARPGRWSSALRSVESIRMLTPRSGRACWPAGQRVRTRAAWAAPDWLAPHHCFLECARHETLEVTRAVAAVGAWHFFRARRGSGEEGWFPAERVTPLDAGRAYSECAFVAEDRRTWQELQEVAVERMMARMQAPGRAKQLAPWPPREPWRRTWPSCAALCDGPYRAAPCASR